MDYYKILKINYNSTKDDIKTAYRELVKVYHPDKETGDEDTFKMINEAYETLSDDSKRKDYDRTIKIDIGRNSYYYNNDLSNVTSDNLYADFIKTAKKHWKETQKSNKSINKELTVKRTLKESYEGGTKSYKLTFNNEDVKVDVTFKPKQLETISTVQTDSGLLHIKFNTEVINQNHTNKTIVIDDKGTITVTLDKNMYNKKVTVDIPDIKRIISFNMPDGYLDDVAIFPKQGLFTNNNVGDLIIKMT